MSFRHGWIVPLTAACAVAQPDAVDVLARFGAITRENASRMTNCTCVETIERQYYRARLTTAPRNCDELAAEKRKPGYKLTQESTDRLRLEVRVGTTDEMFSWPGANRFDDPRAVGNHRLWARRQRPFRHAADAGGPGRRRRFRFSG